MDEVLWRQKAIQYASRTAQHIDAVATKLNLRHTLSQRSGRIPRRPSGGSGGTRRGCAAGWGGWTSSTSPISRRRIRFRRAMPETSRRSISARRDAGYQDLKRALREAPWFTHDKPEALCALVHKVKDGEVTTLSATPSRPTSGSATMKRSAA